MPTIAIGDIHGNLPALRDLLGKIDSEIRNGDTVVFLGDYIDRGPSSKQCIDAILAFRDETLADVVCLRGNHEDWMLRTLDDYCRHSWLLGMEAFETIRSYSSEAEVTLRHAASEAGSRLYLERCALPYEAFFGAVPLAHLQFFQSLRPYCQTPDCLCVHAGVGALPGEEEGTSRDFVWGTTAFPDAYGAEEYVVYGHHNNAELDATGWPHPKRLGGTIGLDTIAHGVLTAIRLPDSNVFQSAVYRDGSSATV